MKKLGLLLSLLGSLSSALYTPELEFSDTL
jgi:hypothetical protein